MVSTVDKSVLVSRDLENPAVVIVKINRPKLKNALNLETMTALARAFEMINATNNKKRIKAIVLTGAGSSFCAGVDLLDAKAIFNGPMFRDYSTDGVSNSDPMHHLERCRIPVICAVEGAAVTGGVEIALACDMIIAGESATFRDTHNQFGIVPFWGLSQKLSRIVGANRAKEFCFCASKLPAKRAYEWGLVNHVVPDGNALNKALETARIVARHPTQSTCTYKRLIDQGLESTYKAGRTLEFKTALAFYGSSKFQQSVKIMAQAKAKL